MMKSYLVSRMAAAALVWLAAMKVLAQETNTLSPDKSAYNLFNPVPKNLLRDLSPDRPDKTEAPYTVDAGHFQVEADFANFTYDTSGGTRTRAWQVGDFNLKAGLFNNVDLQLVYDSYLNVETQGSSGKATQSGWGDLTTRLKINLWGNEGGTTAFALLPYAKFPTSTDALGNNAVEGGLILPLAVSLPHGFDLSLETAVSFRKNEAGDNYHEDVIASASLDHHLIGKLSGYVEWFSDFSTESHAAWIGTVDFGLEYLLTKNLQFDGGCNFGVTHAADDFNPFAGITWRF